MHTGWTRVQRNEFVDYNLEKMPLQIKTDSLLGSGDVSRVYFYDSQSHYAGAFEIRFDSTPQYYIRGCRSHTDFPTNLPSATDKIWKIALLKSSETINEQVGDESSAVRLVVDCNGMEVLNFVFSPSTCPDNNWISPYLGRHVTRIWFYSRDTASDYYVSQPGNLVIIYCIGRKQFVKILVGT